MNNLKKIRSLVGMTQNELADAIGVSKTTIVNAELGVISVEMAKKCAKVLDVNVFSILGHDVLKLQPETKEDQNILIGEIFTR